MRVAFAGTPDFAVPILSAIFASRHTVCLVVTQPDKPAGRGGKVYAPPVKALALEHGAPVAQPESINRPEGRAALYAAAPEALLVVAYGKILTPRTLRAPARGCFNIHASLLPKYRGASPIAHAILHGERETGVTIQRMAPGVDMGPVLMRRAIAIGAEETAGELSDRLAALAAEMVVPFLDGVESGALSETPQAPNDEPHVPKLEKGDGATPWARDAVAVVNFIRAMTPWPGAFTFHRAADGRARARLILLKARAAEAPRPEPPGTVLQADRQLIVAAGAGAVELLQVKPEGGKPMDAAAFLRGRAVKTGDKFHGE